MGSIKVGTVSASSPRSSKADPFRYLSAPIWPTGWNGYASTRVRIVDNPITGSGVQSPLR